MTVKEYLSKIQVYRRIMQSYADRIEELYHDAAGIKAIVYDKDRVQTSPQDHMEAVFMKIDREAERYVKARARYEREVRKRMAQIEQMDKPEHAELLRWRYVEVKRNGKQYNLFEVSQKIHMSFDRVKHLHGEALEEFRKRFL